MGWFWRNGFVATALLVAWSCGGGDSSNGSPTQTGGSGGSAAGAAGASGGSGTSADASVPCDGVSLTLNTAKIEPSPGQDRYSVALEWSLAGGIGGDVVAAEFADAPDAPAFSSGMVSVDASSGSATANVDKLMKEIFVRLRLDRSSSACTHITPAVRLAKPDYREPSDWEKGWIRVISHTHTIADLKSDAGGPVHANRINWYNGCFDHAGDDAACHELLKKSFSEQGVQWLVDAAKDKGISSVIITDHDNVGVWFTEVFRQYNQASTTEPSVVHGLEWTSALGHLTVVGNFLPSVPKSSSIFELPTAKLVHTSTPLPPDSCDDTDENHDINAPFFDGPDASCQRADHRGHGDDPPSIAEARASIEALKASGALVYANHPTNDSGLEPPMKWQLENFELLDGVELATPDPTLSNRDNDQYWREHGLQKGHRWVGIAGTDCHVNGGPYTGDSGCNNFHGIVNLTHMEAPYMWLRPLTSTSHVANNAPELVTAALREGRVTVVQDVDPAAIADLGIDVNGDGKIDYSSGSTIPACEQPGRDQFEVVIRVRPVQTHDYNVSVWRKGIESKIVQDTEIAAGQVWTAAVSLSRSRDLPPGAAYGHVWAWVRENKTLTTDNDAAFSNPIWFEAPNPDATPCDTRNESGQ